MYHCIIIDILKMIGTDGTTVIKGLVPNVLYFYSQLEDFQPCYIYISDVILQVLHLAYYGNLTVNWPHWSEFLADNESYQVRHFLTGQPSSPVHQTSSRSLTAASTLSSTAGKTISSG